MPDTEHAPAQKSTLSLLVVDDDQDIRDLMADYLRQHGFQVRAADGGEAMFACIEEEKPDLIVLDIMMPGEDGLSLCRRLRTMDNTTPVIFLTALGDTADRVVGLELGADDYLPKPFHLAELLSRIKSVLRRNNQGGEQYVSYGDVKVNPHTFDIWVGDTKKELSRNSVVPLLKKEYDILLYFLQRPNRIVSKNMLAEAIWGDHFDDVDNYDFVYAQIKNLRKRLTTLNTNIEIVAVYGMGTIHSNAIVFTIQYNGEELTSGQKLVGNNITLIAKKKI